MNTPLASRCLNCDSSLVEGQRYCGACGQRVVAGRLTLREIAHDFIQAFTNADRSIFTLVGALLTRPGRVAREYVAGRRKRYFGPFGFLVICVGLATFLTYAAGIEWFGAASSNPVRAFLARHFNLVILVQAPLLALGCWLLFWPSKLHFSEHLVLAAYTSGLRALFLGLIETPLFLLLDLRPTNRWMSMGFLVLWFGYFAFAAAQFYQGNRAWIAIRAVLAGVMSVAATSAFIYLAVYLGYAMSSR